MKRQTGSRGWLVAAGAALGMAAGTAKATWSIIIIDTRTREVALGSATCLTGFDLQANTPILIVGVGGATAQSYVDSSGQNRVFVRDHLQFGTDPSEILDLLSDFDNGHQTRQYGIADVMGRTATFSGTGAGAWAGGMTGQVGDLVYAVQGNVLTGEPVVAAAVQAILDTPGDVPAKMMAAMEAARLYGGDGRCSCTNGPPDACGAPPPDFEKSSHIAYMLDARIGDRDGGNGIYRAGSVTSGLAAHDFDGDGRVDLLAGAASSNDLLLLKNTTQPGDAFVTFASAEPIALAATTRDVVIVDVNKDARMDLVAANSTASTVSVLLGLDGGGFGAASAWSVGTDPRALAVADLDGDGSVDIATANSSSSSISLLFGDGEGGFGDLQTFTAGGGIVNIAATDLDGDGDTDLCFAAQTQNSVPCIYNQGERVFKFGLPQFTGGARWVVAHDFNHDGRPDLAVATGGAGNLCLLWNQGGGDFVRQDLACGGSPIALGVGDANGDHKDDLFVLRSSPTDLLVFTGDNLGGFLPSDAFVCGPGNARAVPADLDGDGLDDLATVAGGTKSVHIVQNLGSPGGPVEFNSGLGTATGGYFMSFNVAFSKQQDPDPVYTLRDLFDQWRGDLAGRPDAVASLAEIEPAQLPPDGASKAMLLVTLLDWNHDAADGLLTVAHAPDSDGQSQIGGVTDLGGGRFSVEITAGDASGTDVFRVEADDGVRRVVLMPDVALSLVGGCAADCTGDGTLDLFDFLCFFNRFNAGEQGADCDGDQSLTFFDFLCFTNAFNAGC